jgi:MerR family transcriptional regulator, redox-sensitive transcriptional activator SoxR
MLETPDSSGRSLAIGEVAERTRLQPSAIRYYERRGLLPPPERASGRRRYGPEVLQLLAAIEVSKAAGFSLEEIKRLFDGFDRATPPSERWRELATKKLRELDVLSGRITGMRALLRRGLECGCLGLEDCELLGEVGSNGDAGGARL